MGLLLTIACSSGSGEAATTTTDTTSPAPPPSSTTTTATTTTAPPLPPLPGPAPGTDVGALVTPTGVTVPVRATAGDTSTVQTPCGRTATVTGGTPLTGATVVLDPGHGGDENGAVGPTGLREADLNLAVARRTAARLTGAGAAVVLTRTTDQRTTLGTRALLATRLSARAFVSIHHNAEPDGPSPRPGTETWYSTSSAESRRLGGLLQEELVRAFSRYDGVPWQSDTDAGAKTRRNSRGQDYYGVLRQSAGVPAALTEALFLSNPPEAELLARPRVQRAEAAALARGIARFLTTADPGSGFVDAYPRSTPAGPGGGSTGCVDPPLS